MTPLQRLAERAGIEDAYWDIFGTFHPTTDDARRRILAAMGYDAETDAKATLTLARLEDGDWAATLEPVVVLRRGAPAAAVVTIDADKINDDFFWRIDLEEGGHRDGIFTPNTLPPIDRREGRIKLQLPLPDDLALGYHDLGVEGPNGTTAKTRLIMAPEACFLPEWAARGERRWGIAAHAYALRSRTDWGMGDLGALADLAYEAGRLGAAAIGINPMHAAFPHLPEHASPYSPSSRLYLNPLYLDLGMVPGYHFEMGPSKAELAKLRSPAHVDYTAVAKAKLAVLERLFTDFPDNTDFEQFRQSGGVALEAFGTFNAILEDQDGRPLCQWPEALRRPDSPAVAEVAKRKADRVTFHIWLQWLVDRQLGAVDGACTGAGMSVGLYRDLAVGIDPEGAEAWADPDLIVNAMRFGAPPDALAPQGQDWGAPPMHPVLLRERAYEPFARVLRANMKHAGALRIDHAMCLLHLYWIPLGGNVAEAAYVRYPYDDLLAVLALESHRNRCMVIGEDLGTVPDGFRERMEAERILSYRVMYFERYPDGLFKRPDRYPHLSLATATTHDMATIKGRWEGRDLALRVDLGLYPDQQAATNEAKGRDHERVCLLGALHDQTQLPTGFAADDVARPDGDATLAAAVQGFLARSQACLMMANLDDLVGEPDPLNLPGTVDQYPNWRRRLSVEVSDIAEHDGLRQSVKAIRRERG